MLCVSSFTNYPNSCIDMLALINLFWIIYCTSTLHVSFLWSLYPVHTNLVPSFSTNTPISLSFQLNCHPYNPPCIHINMQHLVCCREHLLKSLSQIPPFNILRHLIRLMHLIHLSLKLKLKQNPYQRWIFGGEY